MSNESVIRQSRVLGLNVGTARNRLRKSLMYHMAMKLNMLSCFRCGELIDSEDEFSIEHKVDWMTSDNPTVLFYDVENIAFSHLRCNSSNSSGGRVHADKIRRSPEHHKERIKRYRKSEKYKEYRRTYERERYASDSKYRNERLRHSKNK